MKTKVLYTILDELSKTIVMEDTIQHKISLKKKEGFKQESQELKILQDEIMKKVGTIQKLYESYFKSR